MMSYVAGNERSFVRSTYVLLLLILISSMFGGKDAIASYNIASDSSVSSSPYIGATIKYLFDGIVDDASENTLVMLAPLAPRIGGGVQLVYEFKYPENVKVTGVNIFQCSYRNGRSPAKVYKFDGDITGAGKYTENLVKENEGIGGRWYKYNFNKPISLRAIRFSSLEWDKKQKGPNYGVPAICEIEIFSEAPLLHKKDSRELNENVRLLESVSGTQVSLATKNASEGLSWSKQFPRGIFTTMWKYWSPGKPYDYKNNLATLKKISDTGANRLWLYPAATAERHKKISYTVPQTEYNKTYALRRLTGEKQWAGKEKYRIYPFPSDIVIGSKNNILKELTGQAHAVNLGLIVNQRLLPYGLEGWDFPRVFKPEIYPCILSSPIVKESAKKLVKELLASGVDGVAIGGDEFFYHGHTGLHEDTAEYCRISDENMKQACQPTCQALFETNTAFKVPLTQGDTEKDRAWQLFEYNQLAELFSSVADEIKNEGDDKVVTSLFRPGEVKRAAYGVAYDIMGSKGKISEMSSDPLWANDNFNGHYYIANETKKLVAASVERKGIVTLQTTPHYDEQPFKRPIMVYGSAISALMHGAKGINYYKDEYIYTDNINSPLSWVTKVFQLISYLDDNGLQEYKPPSNIAVLYSRSSEDWWSLKYPRDPVRGYYPTIFQNSVMEVLFRNGIPYELFYLDQPDSLSTIKDADLIIVPFASSINADSFQYIQQAKNAGTNIVWLGGDGEIDEVGNEYKGKLRSLLHINDADMNMLELGEYESFSSNLISILRRSLPSGLPLQCSSLLGDADVECSMLSNGKDYLIFMQNWDKKDIRLNIKSALKEGAYDCELIDLEKRSKFTIDGEVNCSENTLNDFHVDLKQGDVKIIFAKYKMN